MELVDYSGKFDPDFSFEKLTKETLLKLSRSDAEYVSQDRWTMVFSSDAEMWQRCSLCLRYRDMGEARGIYYEDNM